MSDLSDWETTTSPKILLIKLSSLGDVLHNLPIVWDIRRQLPNAQIDWVVEEAYVHLLAPLLSKESFKGIDRIIPFSLRRWKKNLGKLNTWKQFFAFRKELRASTYDVIIETQGLIKSAVVCGLATKSANAVIAGLANATQFSGYEPLARSFYSKSVAVPVQCHAIDRSRRILSAALKWPAIERSVTPLFYPEQFLASIPAHNIPGITAPYMLFFHSTAREAKRWSDSHWIALGNALAELGYQIVLPWGNTAEQRLSMALAKQIRGSFVPPAFSIEEAFPLIVGATLTVGVDTGLTHLAAVLNKPTVEIYCDSPRWKTEGYWSQRITNVGDMQTPPSVEEVLKACKSSLSEKNV
ncbi:heptosyltransferase-1 [Polynucleobacter meluiroseus]|uniref:Lipopolysaccharide heptosyltransferase 1 n=1 Tax=Polynucleobacter meluiroseus TaxID=1938814 RepID=A0A240E1E2_9BURK|nr:lipopolysaccharide heptosyltransferase I [Polynucleobacter meluiroseus]SNX29047.1 heptosyltransferase-1 [Polynucleobacter meluiroseus]